MYQAIDAYTSATGAYITSIGAYTTAIDATTTAIGDHSSCLIGLFRYIGDLNIGADIWDFMNIGIGRF